MYKKYLFSFACFVTGTVFSGLEFSDQDAVVYIKSGAQLTIAGSAQTVTGTLKYDSGATVNGTAFTLSDGVVVRGKARANITGTYNPTGPAVTLAANDVLTAGRNFAVGTISVTGSGSTLAGFPIFSSSISLPTGIGLNCNLQIPLNKTITLDGGTLTLDGDLSCANDVFIGGSGTVDLNGHQLAFARFYTSDVTGTLSFTDAKNIILQGRTPLAADWTFNGICLLDGKGGTLDLSAGGSITIGANTRLIIRDTLLRGLTNANLVFTDATSILEVDRSQFELAGALTTSAGKVEVTGSSMWIMRDYDWTFNGTGKLTLDQGVLSLNIVDNDNGGTVKASRAVFVDHLRNSSNISTNVADENLLLLNGGDFIEMGERFVFLEGGGGGGDSIEPEELSLETSVLLKPTEKFAISEDTTIDGKGSRIMFSRSSGSQLKVFDGITLALKNVELHGLTNNSIEMGIGAKITVEDEVIFSLDEDVTWSSEQIALKGDATTLQIRGLGTQRTLTFTSEPVSGGVPLDFIYQKHLDLAHHTVLLENVVLDGLRHVSYTTATVDGVLVTGGFTLGGNATLELRDALAPHTVVVKGLDNRLRLRNDDVTITGAIRYDESAVSALHFAFISPADFYGVPRLFLNDGSLKVSSANGQAYLYADVHRMQLVNNAAGSCEFGNNSFIIGSTVDVDLHSIKQTSARVTLMPGLELTSSLPAGALTLGTDLLDTMRSPWSRSESKTIFELLRQRRMQYYDQQEVLRGLSLPNEALKPVAHYESAFALPEIAGNMMLRSSRGQCYTNFRMSTTREANLTLKDGVCLIQGSVATTVKNTDIINVIGGSLENPNVIQIGSNTTINGKLMLDDDAVLLIRSHAQSAAPAIVFGADSQISFGARSRLIIAGETTVSLSDGYMLNLGADGGQLVISDGASLTVDNQTSLKVGGHGSLTCERGGQIVVATGGAITCGTAYADEVTIRAKTGGSVRVGDAFAADSFFYSYLSFQQTGGALDFSQGGTLVIAERGVCECNSLLGVAAAGTFDRLDFSGGGLLYVGSGGTFRVSDNIDGQAGMTAAFHGGQISGSGTVGVGVTSFLGKVQPNIFSATNMTAAQVVRQLVQTDATLVHSTLFTNSSGSPSIRTKNGAVITLEKGDTIISESDEGVLSIYNTANRQRFTYSADGVRSS